MSRQITALAAVVAVSLLAGVAFVGTGTAGDGSTLVYPTPEHEQQTVEQGDEFEIELLVSEHGDLLGNGLESFTLVAGYDESKLTATDIESAGWFDEGNESVEIHSESEIDEESGVVTLSEEIEPSGDGVLNTAQFATVTFEVDETAETGNTTVGLGNSTAALTGGYQTTIFPQPINQDGPNGPEVMIESADQPADESDDTAIGASALVLTMLVGVGATALLAAVALGRKK